MKICFNNFNFIFESEDITGFKLFEYTRGEETQYCIRLYHKNNPERGWEDFDYTDKLEAKLDFENLKSFFKVKKIENVIMEDK